MLTNKMNPEFGVFQNPLDIIVIKNRLHAVSYHLVLDRRLKICRERRSSTKLTLFSFIL